MIIIGGRGKHAPSGNSFFILAPTALTNGVSWELVAHRVERQGIGAWKISKSRKVAHRFTPRNQ